MRDLYRLLVLVFSGGVSILDPSIGLSQTYPVHVTTTIAPPYSVYLSDYASAESNSLNVLLNVLELDRTNLRVKLRVTIDGAGITLRTRGSYLPPAIVLQGGVPELLSGFDLRSYFNADNLDFSGITKAQFLQTGKLPEGFYTFRIEVLEYTRNVLISSPMGGQANAWVVLNDPPLINMPFKGDKVRATDPQNVLFSWTPRHTASPNSAFSTEYEFRLVEMYPGQTNPDAAIRSSNSIYTTKTTLTSLNYGIVEPILTPGKHYAFRIRAYDTSGRDLFKNSGYSETYHFQYGDNCILPANISAEALDPNRVKITWETDQVHSKFNLDFRKVGLRDWQTNETFLASQIYPELTPATTYEYRLHAVCGSISGNPSAIFTVTTLKENEVPAGKTKFSCGADSPTLPEHEGSCTIPLAKPLLPLSVIKAGDLNIIVSQAILQPDGSYTGKGHVPLPMFNAASFRVILRNVQLNEHYRLIGGSIKTVYDETNRPMGDVEKELDDLAKEREKLEGESEDGGAVDGTASWSADVTTPITGEIQNIELQEDGTLLVTMENGTTQTVPAAPEGQTQAITDSSGDAWLVDSEGNVTPIPAGSTGSGGSSSPALATSDGSNLKGLDSLVYEIIIDRISLNQIILDSLRGEMKPFSVRINEIIENENFYPPRIRGENDELIGENISLHIGISNKTNEVKARLSKPVLEIDETRNKMIILDIEIQRIKEEEKSLLELKSEKSFIDFISSLLGDSDFPNDLEGQIQYVKIKIEETINDPG